MKEKQPIEAKGPAGRRWERGIPEQTAKRRRRLQGLGVQGKNKTWAIARTFKNLSTSATYSKKTTDEEMMMHLDFRGNLKVDGSCAG